MRDYSTIIDGREVKVADMTTEDIQDTLADGVESYDPSVTVEAIMDRLALELFIRERKIRV